MTERQLQPPAVGERPADVHLDPPGATPAAVWIGAGYGLVSRDAIVLLDATNYEIAERIWGLLEHGADVDDILELVSGVGLRTLDDLAIAVRERDGFRVVLRGTATAAVETPDGRAIHSADGTKTWRELVVPDVSRIEMRLSGAAATPTAFRVEAGVVPAIALAWPATSVRLRPERDLDGLDAVPHPEPAAPTEATVDSGVFAARAEEAVPPAESGAPATHLVADEAPVDAGSASDDEPNEYDDLYGRTVARSVQGAAMAVDTGVHDGGRPGDTQSGITKSYPDGGGLIGAVPGVAPAAAGDHDGLTVARHTLTGAGAAPGTAPPTGAVGGPTVQATMCPSGHPNPPHASACRVCRQPLGGTLVTVARPSLGRLVLSTGRVVELDRPALLGRNPRVEGRIDQEMPQLVVIDVGQALSRTHVAVRLSGWEVQIEDMGSANGTTVTAPGRAPQRLRASEPLPLEPGALVDLGGEVTLRYDAV